MSAGWLPCVHVLLATYNGERHLPAQWESLERQQGVRLVLHVADDGSSDGTLACLRRLAAVPRGAVERVEWCDAPPRRSATRSFLMLLQQAVRSEPEAGWFAFCDQDDVWLAGKLQKALAALSAADPSRPALYGGRTLSVDEHGREVGPSPLFARPPDFRNALVQSLMGGNTMVLNRPAAEIVSAAPPVVIAHDWLCYQAVTGAGGLVRYDPEPQVHYRQHAANVVGSNDGWRARWKRLGRLIAGDFRDWNDRNVAALQALGDRLTEENRRRLDVFARSRLLRNPLARLMHLRACGIYRQTAGQQLTLWVAVALGRL